jgi:hypothetical protein
MRACSSLARSAAQGAKREVARSFQVALGLGEGLGFKISTA